MNPKLKLKKRLKLLSKEEIINTLLFDNYITSNNCEDFIERSKFLWNDLK